MQEPADAFYGDRTAAVKDPAGNTMFATRQEKLTDEDLSARAREHMP